MRGAVLYGPRDVRFEEREAPKIVEPTDAIIGISATCVCGSDLWPYRGIQPVNEPTPMGHEYCGIAPMIGARARPATVKVAPRPPASAAAARGRSPSRSCSHRQSHARRGGARGSRLAVCRCLGGEVRSASRIASMIAVKAPSLGRAGGFVRR